MTLISLNQALEGFARLFDGDMSAEEATEWLIRTGTGANIVQSIAPATLALRARLDRDGTSVQAPPNAIDVCGTGGDGQHTLNISTAVAIVVAACGVPVAKHGNRAATSLAGGADTLEALGLNLANASTLAEKTLAEIGIAFLFAQKHHPALAWLGPIRKSLGRPTVLNLIGPLCNPAKVSRQLIGVPSEQILGYFEQIPWEQIGVERVIVATGAEGLDEISISGPSRLAPFGLTLDQTVTPEDAGLPRHPLDAIRGGDAAFNAAALRRLLMGEPGAYRDAVLLNAAAALIVAGEAADWHSGVEEAAEAIDKGLANALLDCWIDTVK